MEVTGAGHGKGFVTFVESNAKALLTDVPSIKRCLCACRELPSADEVLLRLTAARSNTTFLRDCIHRSVTRSCPLPIEELTSGSFLARLVCPDTPAEPAPAVPRWVLSCTGHTAHAAASHPIFAPNPAQLPLRTHFAAQMIMQQGDEKFLRNLHIFHHYHHPVSVVSIVTVFYIVAKIPSQPSRIVTLQNFPALI